MSADELNLITSSHFDESRYYTSKEHNLSGFFDWEAEMFERYFRPGSRLLVGAAGAGREILALRKAGFDAEGFECSMPLVNASQKIFDDLGELNSVKYWPQDTVPPGPAAHDGLVLGWSAYTHIPTSGRRIRFLQDFRKRVPPQSPLIISFFTRTSDSSNEKKIHRAATFCGYIFFRKEPSELGDRIEWGRFVHRFTRDELEAEMKTAGFRVECYGEEGGLGYAVAFSD